MLASVTTAFCYAALALAVDAWPASPTFTTRSLHPAAAHSALSSGLPRPPRRAAVTAVSSRRGTALLLAASSAPSPASNAFLVPIWACVFVQMLGVGVTLSTLPLYLTALGCSPAQLAVVISIFSSAQMVGAPFLVGLSARLGRLTVLRFCLAGNAVASLMTAASGGWRAVAAARFLAGLFAASVPVAQVSIAEAMPPGPATSKALSRVASATSLGIICGPAAAGVIGEILRRVGPGVTAEATSRAIFGCSGSFALLVLALTSGVTLPTPPPPPTTEVGGSGGEGGGGGGGGMAAAASRGSSAPRPPPPAPRYAQLVCRWTALVCSFALTLGVAQYALFALAYLGYGQREIAIAQSSAAAAALAVNLLLLPRLIDTIGEAAACAGGLCMLGLGLGASSIFRQQPTHAAAFLLSRAGLALADTTAAALTAKLSPADARPRNLALLQSTQSGSRIFSPLLAAWLYSASLRGVVTIGPPGALPFLVCSACALLTAPVTLLALRPRRSGGGATTERTTSTSTSAAGGGS